MSCLVRTDLVIDPTDRHALMLVEAARVAEAVGFDGVWTYDHLSGTTLGGASTQDVWALLGAVALATEHVAVGPLVANVTTRHPAALAIAAATLQELSEGRAWLGIGAGAGPNSPFAEEMTMVGMTPSPAAARRAMVAEAVQVIRSLWDGKAHFAGEHFGLSDASGFPRPDPHPPILVGCNGPKLAAVAAEVADGVNFHSVEPDLAGLIEGVRRASPGGTPIITVEALLAEQWVRRDHPYRAMMEALGVDRLMLRWQSPDDLSAIERAGVLLRS